MLLHMKYISSEPSGKFLMAYIASERPSLALKMADAVSLHAELDRENGKTVYEIEFRVGKVEYEYEIDAYSGAVLKAESDVDD